MKWRNPYDTDENEYYDKLTQIDCTGDPGMTLQAPTEEQDINVIMKRFGIKDGSVLPRWQDPQALYGDFTEIPTDPVEAAEYIRRGEVAFATLPATIRTRFDSGARLFNWLTDPKNEDEAVTLGILERKKTPPVPPLVWDNWKKFMGEQSSVSSSTSSDKEPLVPTPST